MQPDHFPDVQQLLREDLIPGIGDLNALALVDDLGCDAPQGYLMGRPVPAEEFDLEPIALRRGHGTTREVKVPRLHPAFAD